MNSTAPEVHILTAFAPVREAVGRAVPERGDIFLCFDLDLFNFVAPLEKNGARVFLLPSCKMPSPWKLSEWLELKSQVIRINKCLTSLGEIHCFFVYAVGFNLGSLITTSILARSNSGLLSSYDDYHSNPTCYWPVNTFKQRLKGLLLSWWVSAPIVFSRASSPIPRLTENFIRTGLTRHWEAAKQASFENFNVAPHTSALKSKAYCSVLWLYDDFATYYRFSEEQLNRWDMIWESAVQAIGQYVPRDEQAIKLHPGFKGSLPHYFQGLKILPTPPPIEFIEFPQIKMVIACNSLATMHFFDKKHCEVHLITNLLALPPHGWNQMQEILSNRLLPFGTPVVHCNFESMIASLSATASNLHDL
jgi:hypothetical protein